MFGLLRGVVAGDPRRSIYAGTLEVPDEHFRAARTSGDGLAKSKRLMGYEQSTRIRICHAVQDGIRTIFPADLRWKCRQSGPFDTPGLARARIYAPTPCSSDYRRAVVKSGQSTRRIGYSPMGK